MTTVDEKLREATVAVLAEHGWTGVTLERVAEKAGRSRVTLWRQGLTRELLLDALLDDLATDYRDTMWPALTATGTGREGLVRAIEAFCDVVDRHLPLVLASDTIFHREAERGGSVVYIEPFERFIREGAVDGSLHPRGRIDDVAEIVMVSIGFSYAHMRGRHHWSRARTRRVILDLVLRGIVDA